MTALQSGLGVLCGEYRTRRRRFQGGSGLTASMWAQSHLPSGEEHTPGTHR